MFKATLAASILASVSATTQQDVVTTASAAQHKAQQRVKSFKSAEAAMALSTIKNLKLSASPVTLSSKRVSQNSRGATSSKQVSRRTLRGKAGKGKGKDDDHNDDATDDASTDDAVTDDDHNDDGTPAPRLFLQMQGGMCAGEDLGGETLTENMFFSSFQVASGSCINNIDSDGDAYSFGYSITEDPFTVTTNFHRWHHCTGTVLQSADVTNDITGGTAPNGGCADGFMISTSETSLALSDRPSVLYADVGDANACNAAASAEDLAGFAYVEITETSIETPFGTFPLCNSEDGDDDDSPTTYFEYDTSQCGVGTITINHFSDEECNTPTGGSTSDTERMCAFDLELFNEDMVAEGSSDMLYVVETCSA